MSREDYESSDAAMCEAVDAFVEHLEENQPALSLAANIGDGECGYLIERMKKILQPDTDHPVKSPIYSKVKINSSLRTEVFERDEYRCLRCGSWKDLRADHVVPEVKDGLATMDNLQTLCRSCNSWKGTKTIDFRGDI